MKIDLTLLVALVMSITMLNTCIQIEFANKKAGNFLPRNFVSIKGNPKWRDVKLTIVELEAKYLKKLKELDSKQDGKRLIVTYEPLTAQEENQLHKTIMRLRYRQQLKEWIQGMGLLQYFLVSFTSLLCLWILSKKKLLYIKIVAGLCLILSIGCGICMLYRGYFSSLGY